MDPEISVIPLITVLVPLAAALAIIACHARPNLKNYISILAACGNFLLVISMAPSVLQGKVIHQPLFTVLPGIEFGFRVDSLGMIFATVSSLLWVAAAIYSIGYMRSLNEKSQSRFFACFATSLAAAVGGAFAANLFTLVIFYEVLSLVTYPLVYHKENADSWLGSKKYLVYLVGASKTFLLAALALTFAATGGLSFEAGGIFNDINASPLLLTVIYCCFLAGFAKAAIMPFHIWLPSAMVAPTPVSALLHAVAVVKMGVFCVLRVVFDVFGQETMHQLDLGIATAYLVSFTIIIASVYALTQDDLKARLAYSTVSQLSYIILGAVLLTPASTVGGLVHIASHGVSKITLFFCAGSLYCATRKTKISELAGIGKQLPWTMAAFFIASLGMIGIPPASGFISKWYLLTGAIEADQLIFLWVLLISSVLNAAYFLPISYKAFFETQPSQSPDTGCVSPGIKEIPLVTIPLVATAILSLVLGIYPHYFLALAQGVLG